MKKIFKYPLPVADLLTLGLPRGAEFLSVQVQHGAAVMWFLVDTEEPEERRRFVVVGTGQAIQHAERLTYLGTFQMEQGRLVLHLFEGIYGDA